MKKEHKAKFSSLPVAEIISLVEAFYEGDKKYSQFNWRQEGALASKYFDAAMRHLLAWWTGEDYDEESPTVAHHLRKAISNLLIILDADAYGMLKDDRPEPLPGWLKSLNEILEAAENANGSHS